MRSKIKHLTSKKMKLWGKKYLKRFHSRATCFPLLLSKNEQGYLPSDLLGAGFNGCNKAHGRSVARPLSPPASTAHFAYLDGIYCIVW